MDRKELENEFRKIGICKGDTLFLRISYKALGEVIGGPQTVIEALKNTVGINGNLIATAYGGPTMSPYWHKRLFQEKVFFQPNCVKNINTGIIPVFLAKQNNSYWSSHPTFPYVVWGKNAKQITDNHTYKSSAYGLLAEIRDNYNAKTIRIGGYILTGTTHFSFTEAMKESNNTQRIPKIIKYYIDENNNEKMNSTRNAAFCFDAYDYLFRQHLVTTIGVLFHGSFFKSEATLINMKQIYKSEKELISNNPETLLCDNPKCNLCPHTYSFSKHKIQYATSRLKFILTDPDLRNKSFKELKKYLNDLIFIKDDVQ